MKWIKAIKEAISRYAKQLNKIFPFIKTLTLSTIILLVIFAIDIYDIPSQLIIEQPKELLLVFALAGLTIAILWLIQGNILYHIKMPIINSTDRNIACTIVIVSICSLVWTVSNGDSNCKTIAAFALLVVCIILLILRIYFYNNTFKSPAQTDKNIFDLKDIYNNSFEVEENKPILITEKDADYDLLNRSGLISQLYDSIISYKSERSFVIGLIGEWGSGKTTLINNVKKKLAKNNDVVIIDNFDPWVFGTQEALLISMYDMILQHTGINFSVSRNRNNVKKLSATIADLSSSIINVPGVGELFNLLSLDDVSYDDIDTLKEELSTFLKTQDKTVVFIIDNIDRAEADNIIFLFKIIATIFDLPNLLYILSYDKERVDKILKDTMKINPKYAEKIIQKEIYMPAVQPKQIQNLYGTCIENILRKYGVSSDEIAGYIPLYKAICTEIDNLRNFKRLINSAFTSVFTGKNYLNKMNLLAIEVIRLLEPSLYDIIRTTPVYFISHNQEYNEYSIASAFNRDNFNKKGKQFFSELFDRYPSYKDLLSSIFPYVKRYKGNYELISLSDLDKVESQDIEKNMSICSAKYFDLYFSYGDNEFLSLATKTKEFFRSLKSRKMELSVYDSFCKLFDSVSSSEHKVWIEGFQQYLDEVPQEFTLDLALAIWKKLNSIDNSSQFLALNARQRATVIISILIEKSELSDILPFAELLCESLSKLEHVSSIIYWLEHSKFDEVTDDKECINIMRQVYTKCCQKIIEKKINMYEDPNYSRHNIWGLFRFYKDNTKKEEILSGYINDIFSSQYVYRYIGDAISQSTGSRGYGYQINSANFKALYFDEEMIDAALEERPPQTESEHFVLDVYQKYKKGEENIFGECGVNSHTEIKIKL